MEAWGEGHIALFEALSAICTRVGDESAADLASAIKRPNGHNFSEQLSKLKEKASQVDELHSENVRLRAELAAALERQRDGPQPTSLTSGVHADHHAESKATQTNVNLDVSDRYEALVTKYNILFTNHRQMSSARQELETKLRKARTERQNWINYANSLTKRIQKLETKLNSHNLLDKGSFKSETGDGPKQVNTSPLRNVQSKGLEISIGVRTPSSHGPSRSPRSSDLEGETFVGTPDDAESVTFEILQGKGRLEVEDNRDALGRDSRSSPQENNPNMVASRQGALKDALMLPTLNDRTTQAENNDEPMTSSPPRHSSSTQGDPEEHVQSDGPRSPNQLTSPIIKRESQSDIPVVLFSRSVRKKQKTSATPQKVRIKIEKITSSPLRITDVQHDDSPQSLDLDDVGEKVQTPRKRKRSSSSKQTYPSVGGPLLHRAMLSTPNNQLHQPSTPEVFQSGQGRRSLGTIPVLQPMSTNKQILPRTSEHKDKRRRLEDRVQGARVFSEDGEDGTPISGKAVLTTSVTPVTFQKGAEHAQSRNIQRLSGLLEEPSPERLRLTPGGNSFLRTAPAGDRQNRQFSRENQQNVSDNNVTSVSLRARPLERLGLEDFKVNPNYNQGYEYAFSDVVRGRDQRKCLPGCTNPACCGGTFRKMAASLMRTRNGRPTPSQEQEDEILVNNFLGTNRGRLRTMSKEEREELVLQARTRDLAKKHGKHRHAYERRPSPPGFWRPDFPSTQEEAADRAEAIRVERSLVQQRYDEAMREGGAWLFRDE